MNWQRIQIAGTVTCTVLVALWFLAHGIFLAYEVAYFGLAFVSIPMVIGSSWWVLKKAPMLVPQ